MVRKPVVLITGASGEIGHGLIESLSRDGPPPDHHPRPQAARPGARPPSCSSSSPARSSTTTCSSASSRSTRWTWCSTSRRSSRRAAEFTPTTAHQVNVEGTLRLLEFAQKEGESHGRPVVFLYPSSIAAYGLPDLETKARAGRVREDDWNVPTTMYGCNKLYCEHLGRYYARHYKQLAAETLSGQGRLPLRALPRPHLRGDRALRRHLRLRARRCSTPRRRASPTPASCGPTRASRSWRCPTASTRCCRLAAAPRSASRRTVYNVGRLQPLGRGDPDARPARPSPAPTSTWAPHLKRQQIVDSWPADVDDSAARRDWGFAPRYDEARAFSEYLIPTIRERYRG